MYQYDDFDYTLVKQRVEELRDQVSRRLSGKLSEDEFKPLRLRNGIYLQLHAYMLRVAVPYGCMSSKQLRMLAYIAEKYDKGYGHFTTRQNIQYNWLRLIDIPDLLDDLASVSMHAIQTSGNCIRNITCDPFAGVAGDEIIDPRPIAELLRQWSTLHPEFLYLPRKFKIAISGAINDRAAIMVHDIGLRPSSVNVNNGKDNPGFEVWVGGGQGRTPKLAVKINDFVTVADLLPYLEAIMRVYNSYGRRDNLYKARIKILVSELGADQFAAKVNDEFARIDKGRYDFVDKELTRIGEYFKPPPLGEHCDGVDYLNQQMNRYPDFKVWVDNNCTSHRQSGYGVVSISLKPEGGIPGDATALQMREIANIADEYSLSEIRVTHRQNLVLPYVRSDKLYEVWYKLRQIGLAAGNINKGGDIISCPGLDYCTLATARSIPIAQELSLNMQKREQADHIGDVTINISGCINACGHHHVANIGILGLNKNGEEFYQISLGGSADNQSAIGSIVGRGFSQEQLYSRVDRIIDVYVANRNDDEKFIDTYRRLGSEPFKEALYATAEG